MTDRTHLLNFQHGNAKLERDTAILSLPAGHTCPFAKTCRSSCNRETGKITDGPHAEIRCYATGAECLFPLIRKSRWSNFELLKQAGTAIGMASLIERSLAGKKKIKLVRMHQSGDFFNQAYFDAWLMVAQQHPEWIVYGYTKALPFWAKRLHAIPANMRLVASRGGTHDNFIELFGLRSARVVLSEREARRKWKLQIDHDDTHCWNYDKDFAILIHGTQPKGSKAGKAWYKLHKHGRGGYKSEYFKGYVSDGKGGKCKKSALTVPAVTVTPKNKEKAAALAVVLNTKPFKLTNPNPRAGKVTIKTKALVKAMAHA